VLLPNYEKVVLENYRVVEQVQLAVFGCSSSGKTSFIQQFLGIDAFLPTDIGSATNRIVQFSYAPAEEATLLIHEGGVDSPAIGDPIPLSEYFIATYPMAASDRAQRLKRLKRVVAQYLSCPVNLDRSSNGFEQWASQVVEFRIPSQTLQLGITVYDTPSFFSRDPPTFIENFRNLIKARRPSLLFLYDNASVSDDSRECFNALKFSIIDKADINIFFLNTKVDVLLILNNADINEEEYEDCEWCELLVEEYRR
jgi:GTPase SAR1 family protein